jgi:hypothetical protein
MQDGVAIDNSLSQGSHQRVTMEREGVEIKKVGCYRIRRHSFAGLPCLSLRVDTGVIVDLHPLIKQFTLHVHYFFIHWTVAVCWERQILARTDRLPPSVDKMKA